MAFNYNDHHWDFLEDIEAPMWVDLAIEAEDKRHDYDDEWFQTSHQYHRCSSRQLKSMFSHAGGASTDLDDDLKGSSSPKLLSSVSRSRGKDYKSKKWRENCDNPRPVKFMIEKLSMAGSGPSEKIKPKLSFVNAQGTSRSKISLAKSTGKPKPNLEKPISAGCFVENTSSSISDKAGESNKSTITSEGAQPRQWKSLGVSSQTYGSKSGLLSTVKITLRKSYTTRPASRVEVNNNTRQSRDRKSSCSKSSVGSSSYPDHYTKGRMAPSTQSKVGGTTPDSRNVNKIEPTQNGAKVYDMHKAPIVKPREGISNSKKVGISNVANPSLQKPIQSKCQNPRANALRSKPNEQDLPTGARKAVGKTRVGGPNRLACTGKENAALLSTEKCNGRDTATEKHTKPSLPHKIDKRGLVAPKGKISGQSEGKILINSIHSRHFR